MRFFFNLEYDVLCLGVDVQMCLQRDPISVGIVLHFVVPNPLFPPKQIDVLTLHVVGQRWVWDQHKALFG